MIAMCQGNKKNSENGKYPKTTFSYKNALYQNQETLSWKHNHYKTWNHGSIESGCDQSLQGPSYRTNRNRTKGTKLKNSLNLLEQILSKNRRKPWASHLKQKYNNMSLATTQETICSCC